MDEHKPENSESPLPLAKPASAEKADIPDEVVAEATVLVKRLLPVGGPEGRIEELEAKLAAVRGVLKEHFGIVT